MTTLHGGDTFTFLDASGNTERVTLSGNITAELIGARYVSGDSVELINLPGSLNGTSVDGGVGGTSGTQTIGGVSSTDTTDTSGSDDTAAAAVSALATNSSGQLYGLTTKKLTVQGPQGTETDTLLQVLQIDKTAGTSTVVAEISAQAVALASADYTGANPQIDSVTAAAFNPVDGRLYFVASGGTSTTPKLFSIDVSGGTRTAIEASLEAYAGSFGAVAGGTNPTVVNIGALAFDTTGTGTARLIAAVNYSGGTTGSSIITVDMTDTNNLQNAVTPSTGGTAVGGTITGLAFSPDNAGVDDTVLAVDSNGANSALLSVSVSTGAATSLGSLAGTGEAQGQNVGDLTYDPTAIDPFTGKTGALYGTDTATHTLFYVDPESHKSTADTIFTIYVSSSDETGAISVSTINTTTGLSTPYSGSIGTLGVTSLKTGQKVSVSAPANSGTAILGARTLPAANAVAGTVSYEPILTATVTQSFGVLDPSITTLHSGLIVAEGNNLGKFLFGGTVLGEVQIHGSIDEFYAGWLLTGDANGETATGTVSDTRNFQVDGDIRELIVTGSIGTDSDSALRSPTYVSGFDLHVDGTIGTVQSGDSIIGSVNGEHASTVTGLTSDQSEIELKGNSTADPWDATADVSLGDTAGNSNFSNDTYATAQYISSSSNATLQTGEAVVVDGAIQDDPSAGLTDKADYYAVSLLAGQTITVRLTQLSQLSGLVLNVGVFDPSGREIATDYSAQDTSATQQQAFQFTATEPGVYRFAVAATGNSTFLAASTSSVTVPTLNAIVSYRLTLQGVGDVGVGNIIAANNIVDNPNVATSSAGFGAASGDFAAIVAGGTLFSFDQIGSNSVVVRNGNLRTVAAANIGIQLTTVSRSSSSSTLPVMSSTASYDPEVSVPQGSVGLLQATASGGILLFNDQLSHGWSPSAIAGDYQIIDAAGNLGGDFLADHAIGTVRAQEIAVDGASTEFKVNADSSGDDGTIDLIDVANNFGDLESGGPVITTGPRGDVRYLHVGGAVYRDEFFGGGEAIATAYGYGNSATIVDDSGASVTLAPTPIVTTSETTKTTATTDVTGTTTSKAQNDDGSTTTTKITISESGSNTIATTVTSTSVQVSVITYGIEGSGGSAIVNATSTGGLDVTANGRSAEIGTLASTQTVGQATIGGSVATTTTSKGKTVTVTGLVVAVPSLPTLDTSSTTAPLTFTLSGSARLDVFDLRAGNVTSISNETGGEIVDMHLDSAGTITSSGSIGIPTTHTGADIEPLATEFTSTAAATSSTYTFLKQHYGISIGTSTGASNSGSGDDLISLSAKVVGNVEVLGQIGSLSGTEEGVIVAGGAINEVNVGSGIRPSGSGTFAKAGIFASGVIGNVTGAAGAVIRGDIISNSGIVSLTVNGTISDTTIGRLATFSDAAATKQGSVAIPYSSTAVKNPTLDIGTISTTGNGGIIGSRIIGNHIGSISVHNGFGIFSTEIETLSDGTVGSITADGLGIRDTYFASGYSIGSIKATGNGSLASVADYSTEVRYSETSGFDPYFGTTPNKLTDLDMNLGTTAATPVVPNVTDTGVIQDSKFVGSGNLGTVSAYQIRATDPTASPVVFNFANSIGTISTTSTIDGMSLTTGKLGTFSPGGDMTHANLTISGGIKNLMLRGNFLGSSSIHAIGKNGNIGKLTVLGDVDGTIQADGGKISNVRIVGSLSGSIVTRTLGTLILNGSLGNGSLQVSGNVSSIKVTGDFGKTGDTLSISGSLGTLTVGGNIYANVTVAKNLSTLVAKGSIVAGSTVTVGNVFRNLSLSGDLQAGAVIKAHRLKRRRIKGLTAGTVILT